MGDRAKRAERCEVCRLHRSLCLCSEITPLDLNTRVALVMHRRELPKTTATGPWALAALRNSELHVRGKKGAPLDLSALCAANRRALLLFPSDDAVPLTGALFASDPRPVTLIVPDGNWGQASRAARRIATMGRAATGQLECVTLASGAPSVYALRNEPREGGLATFEAIARALGVIESPAAQERLEALFARLVDRTMGTRGRPSQGSLVNAAASAGREPLEILYQDGDLVAVNKPAGMLVHRGWARDAVPALQSLRDQIGRIVYPVHRLDRATSGVLLFALSGEIAHAMQRQLTSQQVEKRYLALCRGHDPKLSQVDHPIAKTRGGVARPAITDFKLLGHFERYGLYEARPQTGRLHQIRRHLKHASHPIIGDVR
ncbi:MAG TPA: DTW domain-containing protein, partial [Polyangiaceae bacterium]|nr:DTW domain-containing protein [Polyangiaceae bacterium]